MHLHADHTSGPAEVNANPLGQPFAAKIILIFKYLVPTSKKTNAFPVGRSTLFRGITQYTQTHFRGQMKLFPYATAGSTCTYSSVALRQSVRASCSE